MRAREVTIPVYKCLQCHTEWVWGHPTKQEECPNCNGAGRKQIGERIELEMLPDDTVEIVHLHEAVGRVVAQTGGSAVSGLV